MKSSGRLMSFIFCVLLLSSLAAQTLKAYAENPKDPNTTTSTTATATPTTAEEKSNPAKIELPEWKPSWIERLTVSNTTGYATNPKPIIKYFGNLEQSPGLSGNAYGARVNFYLTRHSGLTGSYELSNMSGVGVFTPKGFNPADQGLLSGQASGRLKNRDHTACLGYFYNLLDRASQQLTISGSACRSWNVSNFKGTFNGTFQDVDDQGDPFIAPVVSPAGERDVNNAFRPEAGLAYTYYPKWGQGFGFGPAIAFGGGTFAKAGGMINYEFGRNKRLGLINR